jgi:chromosome segregation ATPase
MLNIKIDKLNSIIILREQTERERREAQIRSEQLQNEIERLKDELTYKKEIIFEKEKLIQDAQYKTREILLERQSVEDRISNECKRMNELVDKYISI